ncbi:MAG TPA: alginate O-acetyltransferase AlgF [Spirochaetia bacterium]|nr:alginate O-acetyltransferase AlgF [Spirochaetia bacterium]
MRASLFVAAVLAFGVTSSLAAAPGSVYGPSAPGDSAFVRVVNALKSVPSLRADLGATRFQDVSYGAASAYLPVAPDVYLVRVAGLELEVIAKTRTYYTVAFTSGGILLFEDATHTDPARAQLFLYNLTSIDPIDLKTSDGKTTVIKGVRPGTSGVKVVNAVSATLAVYSGGTRVGAPAVLALKRGSSFGVFVLGESARPTVFSVQAEVKVP